jgi:hypothetical protein
VHESVIDQAEVTGAQKAVTIGVGPWVLSREQGRMSGIITSKAKSEKNSDIIGSGPV